MYEVVFSDVNRAMGYIKTEEMTEDLLCEGPEQEAGAELPPAVRTIGEDLDCT